MVGKRRWVIVAVLTLTVAVAACGGGAKDTATEQAPAGGPAPGQTGAKIRRGGTLVVALEQNPKSFDPRVYTDVYSGRVVGQVFETLVKYDDKLVPQPWLAEKIEQPDNVSYVFRLRQDVKFHDNTEMDAEAVKFSIDRVRDFKSGPSYSEAEYITESTVVDKYTYKIVIKEPFAPFLNYLSTRLGMIVSPSAVQKQGNDDFGLRPVGTGPFRFVEWKSDNYIKVARNESYWGMGGDGKALPYLDGIELRVVTEPTTRLTALQAGDIHIAEVRDQDLPVVKKDASINVEQKPGFRWSGLVLSVLKPPFDNKALRQAVAFAIDREDIVRTVYEGNAEAANGPIPPPHSWARDDGFKPYTFDLAKAKAKLAEAGRPNGFEFTGYFSAGDSQVKQYAELIQAQLAKAGIKMNVEFADFNGVVVPKAKNQESNAYSIGFNCGFDPDPCIANRFLGGSGFNYFPYNNTRVNELIVLSRQTSSREERAKALKEATGLVMEDSPFIFTHHGVNRYTGSKKVEGWTIYEYPRLTQGYAEYWLKE